MAHTVPLPKESHRKSRVAGEASGAWIGGDHHSLDQDQLRGDGKVGG
jgi:hypothetical protein